MKDRETQPKTRNMRWNTKNQNETTLMMTAAVCLISTNILESGQRAERFQTVRFRFATPFFVEQQSVWSRIEILHLSVALQVHRKYQNLIAPHPHPNASSCCNTSLSILISIRLCWLHCILLQRTACHHVHIPPLHCIRGTLPIPALSLIFSSCCRHFHFRAHEKQRLSQQTRGCARPTRAKSHSLGWTRGASHVAHAQHHRLALMVQVRALHRRHRERVLFAFQAPSQPPRRQSTR